MEGRLLLATVAGWITQSVPPLQEQLGSDLLTEVGSTDRSGPGDFWTEAGDGIAGESSSFSATLNWNDPSDPGPITLQNDDGTLEVGAELAEDGVDANYWSVNLQHEYPAPGVYTAELDVKYSFSSESFPQEDGTTALTRQFTITVLAPTITPTLSAMSDGGVSVDYQVAGTLPPSYDLDTPTIDLFWSPASNYDPNLEMPTGDSVDVEQTHDGPTTFTAEELGAPPTGTKYLLAVADPDHVATDPSSTPAFAAVPYSSLSNVHQLPSDPVTGEEGHPTATSGLGNDTTAVAKFADPAGVVESATIYWGQPGQTQVSAQGTIVQSDPGEFAVYGTPQVYDTAGTYPIAVELTLNSGDSVALRNSAIIAPADIEVTADDIKAQAWQLFKGEVATFTDDNPLAQVTDLSATVSWGDGEGDTESAIIQSLGNGKFAVTAQHTYNYPTLSGQPYDLTVMVADSKGDPNDPAEDTGEATVFLIKPPKIEVIVTKVEHGEPVQTGVVREFNAGELLDDEVPVYSEIRPSAGQPYGIVVRVTNEDPTSAIIPIVTMSENEGQPVGPVLINGPLQRGITPKGQVDAIKPGGSEDFFMGTFEHTWQWAPAEDPFAEEYSTLSGLRDETTDLAAEAAAKYIGGPLAQGIVQIKSALEDVIGPLFSTIDTYQNRIFDTHTLDYSASVSMGGPDAAFDLGSSPPQPVTLSIPATNQFALAKVLAKDFSASKSAKKAVEALAKAAAFAAVGDDLHAAIELKTAATQLTGSIASMVLARVSYEDAIRIDVAP
jgi:hypothetical protein